MKVHYRKNEAIKVLLSTFIVIKQSNIIVKLCVNVLRITVTDVRWMQLFALMSKWSS